MRSFYILWNPRSNLPPTQRFSDRKQAVEVAEIMARRTTELFYVMEARLAVEPLPIPINVVKLLPGRGA